MFDFFKYLWNVYLRILIIKLFSYNGIPLSAQQSVITKS